MKTRILGISLVALSVLGVMAACGGSEDNGDGSQSGIRTQKGLAVAALAENLGLGGGGAGNEDSARSALPPDSSTSFGQSDSKIGFGNAGYPAAPFQQGGTNGLTVQGYGAASADADSAIAEFYFYRNGGIEPVPLPEGRIVPGFEGEGGSSSAAQDLQEVQEITEGEVQPVVDALVAAGIARDDIEFIAQPYYDKFSSSATLRVTIKNISTLDAALSAAETAAKGLGDINFSTNVAYTVNDCQALEIEAMKAAVEDTGERAANFAGALSVQIGGIIGAANYSYFGGPPCGGGYFGGPYPLASGVGYTEGQSGQVQVFANITVTYAIQ